MRMILYSIVIVVLVFGGSQAVAKVRDSRALATDPLQFEHPIAPTLNGLGNYSLPVTTSSSESQFFFDQGLKLTYAFNHSEALRAFKEAVRLDPGNAMAYWGWALVPGPNLNLPMMPDVATQAYEAIQRAVDLKDTVSEKERDFIDAMASRYADKALPDRRPLDLAYAAAMKTLAAKYPQDLDAATLYAASPMNLSPWNYWNIDGSPRERTSALAKRAG